MQKKKLTSLKFLHSKYILNEILMQESEISKIDWFKNQRVESHNERHLQMHPQANTVLNCPSKYKPISSYCQASVQCLNDGPLQKNPLFYLK